MPNPNKLRDDVSALTKKVRKDLTAMSSLYRDLSKEIERRFREELREQKGKMDGLEDFYQLSLLVKRNAQVSSNVLGMLSKLTDIDQYDISEEKDDIEKLVDELTGK